MIKALRIMGLQAGKSMGSARFLLIALLLLFFVSNSFGQLILQVDCGNLGAVPATSRQISWQQLSPFQGNVNIGMSDPSSGIFYITNPPVGPSLAVLYTIAITIQSPPGQRIQFQVTMLPGDSGTIDASNRLSSPSPTFPAGMVSWAIQTAETRYALNGGATNQYATYTTVTNLINSLALTNQLKPGANITFTTNNGVITIASTASGSGNGNYSTNNTLFAGDIILTNGSTLFGNVNGATNITINQRSSILTTNIAPAGSTTNLAAYGSSGEFAIAAQSLPFYDAIGAAISSFLASTNFANTIGLNGTNNGIVLTNELYALAIASGTGTTNYVNGVVANTNGFVKVLNGAATNLNAAGVLTMGTFTITTNVNNNALQFSNSPSLVTFSNQTVVISNLVDKGSETIGGNVVASGNFSTINTVSGSNVVSSGNVTGGGNGSFGGLLTSAHNTLDDGSGNIIASQNITWQGGQLNGGGVTVSGAGNVVLGTGDFQGSGAGLTTATVPLASVNGLLADLLNLTNYTGFVMTNGVASNTLSIVTNYVGLPSGKAGARSTNDFLQAGTTRNDGIDVSNLITGVTGSNTNPIGQQANGTLTALSSVSPSIVTNQPGFWLAAPATGSGSTPNAFLTNGGPNLAFPSVTAPNSVLNVSNLTVITNLNVGGYLIVTNIATSLTPGVSVSNLNIQLTPAGNGSVGNVKISAYNSGFLGSLSTTLGNVELPGNLETNGNQYSVTMGSSIDNEFGSVFLYNTSGGLVKSTANNQFILYPGGGFMVDTNGVGTNAVNIFGNAAASSVTTPNGLIQNQLSFGGHPYQTISPVSIGVTNFSGNLAPANGTYLQVSSTLWLDTNSAVYSILTNGAACLIQSNSTTVAAAGNAINGAYTITAPGSGNNPGVKIGSVIDETSVKHVGQFVSDSVRATNYNDSYGAFPASTNIATTSGGNIGAAALGGMPSVHFPTNGIQIYWTTPFNVAYVASGFPIADFNQTYTNAFIPYTTNIASILSCLFNLVGKTNPKFHITNDAGSLIIESNVSFEDSTFDSFGSLYGLNQGSLPYISWLENLNGTNVAGIVKPTILNSNLITVASKPNVYSISVSTNGNDSSATIGGLPYFTRSAMQLWGAFNPYDIVLDAGQINFNVPEDGLGATLFLAPGQTISGNANGSQTFLNSAMFLSVSNTVRNIFMLNQNLQCLSGSWGGAAGNGTNLGIWNDTFIDDNFNQNNLAANGHTFGLDLTTNLSMYGCQIGGWNNGFEGIHWGINVFSNCVFACTAITNAGSDGCFPFSFGDRITPPVTNGNPNPVCIFEGNITFDLNDDQDAVGGTMPCIYVGMTNAVFDFRRANVRFFYHGVKNNTVTFADNVGGQYTVLGGYWANGTNMFSIGSTAYIVGGSKPTTANPISLGTAWTNTNAFPGTLFINYVLTDSSISGSPGLNMTNKTSGQWFVATNAFVLSAPMTGQASFRMSPGDIFISGNGSSGSAAASITGSYFTQ